MQTNRILIDSMHSGSWGIEASFMKAFWSGLHKITCARFLFRKVYVFADGHLLYCLFLTSKKIYFVAVLHELCFRDVLVDNLSSKRCRKFWYSFVVKFKYVYVYQLQSLFDLNLEQCMRWGKADISLKTKHDSYSVSTVHHHCKCYVYQAGVPWDGRQPLYS